MSTAERMPANATNEETALTLVENRESPIHGTGVFAIAPIAAEALIGSYIGAPTSIDGTYVLWIETDEGDDWRGVDGHGVLRFLNHSRTPNVEFDGADLYALQDIDPGDELYFDYGDEWSHVP